MLKIHMVAYTTDLVEQFVVPIVSAWHDQDPDPWYICSHAKVTEAFRLEQISLKNKLTTNIKILMLFKEFIIYNSSTCFL